MSEELVLDERVSFSRLPVLDEVDKKIFVRSVNFFMKKVSGRARLEIHCKSYSTTGLKKKHSVHLKFYSPNFSGKAEAFGWSFLTVLQDSLKKLERQLSK